MGSPNLEHPENAEGTDQGYPRAAKRARDIARGFLSALSPPPTPRAAESVLLVVSELVTNAVQHGGGVTGFRLRAADDNCVEITVQDSSPLFPHPLPLRADTPGGFGLHLINNLSRSVSVQQDADGGKTVCALVAL